MGSIRPSLGVALGVALLSGLYGLSAEARDQGVVYASGSVADDHSIGIGAMVALPGSELGKGWAVRGSAYTGSYSYETGGIEIDADYSGGDAAIVYQNSGAWGYANFGLGPRYTSTDLSPADPGNRREGSQWDVAVTIDGASRSGPWALTGYVSYGFDMEEYYARADLTRVVSPGLALGVEIGAEGDSQDYSRQVIGGIVRFQADNQPWAIKLSAGVREGDGDSSGYGAVSVSRTF